LEAAELEGSAADVAEERVDEETVPDDAVALAEVVDDSTEEAAEAVEEHMPEVIHIPNCDWQPVSQ
jgi:hypothetical protein